MFYVSLLAIATVVASSTAASPFAQSGRLDPCSEAQKAQSEVDRATDTTGTLIEVYVFDLATNAAACIETFEHGPKQCKSSFMAGAAFLRLGQLEEKVRPYDAMGDYAQAYQWYEHAMLTCPTGTDRTTAITGQDSATAAMQKLTPRLPQ